VERSRAFDRIARGALGDLEELPRFGVRVHRERGAARGHGVSERLLRNAGTIVVRRDLGGVVRRQLFHRQRHALVNAGETTRIDRPTNGVHQQPVREREQASSSFLRGFDDRVRDTFVEGVENFVLETRAGGHREVHVEDAANHRGGVQDAARVGRQPLQPAIHQPCERSRQFTFAFRAHRPLAVLVAHRAVVDEHAHQLRGEQRIALGVAMQVREKLTTRLAAEHVRQPLPDFRFGQARKLDLVEALVPQQPVAALERLVAYVFCPHREADDHSLMLELPHDVLQHVPRRRVRPLHVVEQDDDRARGRGEPEIRHDLVEQRVLVAARLMARRARAPARGAAARASTDARRRPVGGSPR